jgi:hypothetical protein
VELEEEAVLARDTEALDDLRCGTGDLGDPLQLPARGPHAHDGCDRVADRFRVDDGLVPGDHTRPFEPLHTLRHRGRGQADAATELCHREPPVSSQFLQQSTVDVVQ